MGDPDDIQEAYVSLSPLDSADVCPMQVCLLGQGFLRKAKREPLLADGFTELSAGIRGHALMFPEQRR